MTRLPSQITGIASQINFRELPQAKSRTLSALKIHVLVSGAFVFSAVFASSNNAISNGSLAVCAACQRPN